jgi:hypothetical protein
LRLAIAIVFLQVFDADFGSAVVVELRRRFKQNGIEFLDKVINHLLRFGRRLGFTSGKALGELSPLLCRGFATFHLELEVFTMRCINSTLWRA